MKHIVDIKGGCYSVCGAHTTCVYASLTPIVDWR